MPRIRTIKPEFWDSPGTARASLRARLFFIAMWNWADDYGVGTANPRQLVGFAFPNDPEVTEADFPCLSTEVAACFDVVFYEVDGRPFFAIPSWDKHQKNERRAAAKNPGPDKGKRTMRGTSVQSRGSSGPGTGEQGNRGTVKTLAPTPDVDADFDAFWNAYPRKVSKPHAKTAYKAARRKVDAQTLLDAAVAFAASTKNTDAKYVPHPATWLNGERWTDAPQPPARDEGGGWLKTGWE